jgi:hypothetical protein
MGNTISKAGRVEFVILLILFSVACDREDEGSSAIRAGQWSGTGISFAVSGNPQKVNELEFVYSGHAAGTNCSFDYESGASFATVATITGDKFEAELSTFVLSGTFITDSTAEVKISWEAYDSNCDANYTGSMNYTARYDSSN